MFLLSYQQLKLDGKPLVIKPFRYITLDEQVRFCDFLEELGIYDDKLEKLKWCASEYYTYECSFNTTHSKKVKYLNCGIRGICPRCSMSYARKRAEIMYQYLKQNLADNLDFDLKMNQIVLTLPKELHENLDKKTFAKMIKDFMVSFGIEAYGYSIQFRHSKNPLSSRYIHAHVLTLNIKEFNNKLIQNDYYFDLDKMREAWKKTINKFTDLELEKSDPVVINNEYTSIKLNKKKTVHILAYIYRYPIQDLFNVQVRSNTIDYLEKEQFDQDNTILQIDEIKNDPKNLAWCGLMTSTKREYLEKLLQNTINDLVIIKPIPYFIKQIDERSRKCVDCQYNYSEIPIDKGKYSGDNEPLKFS